jgi:hypothetical protein
MSNYQVVSKQVNTQVVLNKTNDDFHSNASNTNVVTNINSLKYYVNSPSYIRGIRNMVEENFYMQSGDILTSLNKLYTAQFESGNFVVRDFNNNKLFETKTTTGIKLYPDIYGQIQILDKNNKFVWSSVRLPKVVITQSPTNLVLENDGSLHVKRQLTYQQNIQEIRSVNGKNLPPDKFFSSYSEPDTIWQTPNNISYSKNDLNKNCPPQQSCTQQACTQQACPVCETQTNKAYHTDKTCNCETPLASVSNYVKSLMENKNTGYSTYMSNPLSANTSITPSMPYKK